jgi:hypothetical protein
MESLMHEPSMEQGPAARRSFFRALVTGIGGAIAAVLGASLAGFYALPALRRPAAGLKACGPVDSFRSARSPWRRSRRAPRASGPTGEPRRRGSPARRA